MLQKVAFISIFKQEYGGGEGRAAHELARRFADVYDTALIVPGDKAGLVFDGSKLKILQMKKFGRGNACIPLLSQENIKLLFGFLDEYQPDIVHAHDPALTGLLAQIWTRMHAKPFVHTSHVLPGKMMDFGVKEVAAIPEGFLADAITNDYMSSFYKNCDAVIALNPTMVESFRRFGYTGQLFVIPNGRNLEHYRASRNAEIGADSINLTCVGFISRRKNQVFLIEMLAHLPERFRLSVIGESLKVEYLEELKKIVHQRGLDGRVLFTGEVKHKDIPAYLEKTHVLVTASKMEVQSLVVIEALASGTPVVGLSNETVDELVDESVGFRLPKETTQEEFARCVERVCNLPQEEYDRLCENSRRRVRNMDWGSVVAQTADAYETLLKNTPVAAPDHARLNSIIQHVPSKPVRTFLRRRAETTTPGKKGVGSVPLRTWVFTSLTVALSVAAQLERQRRAEYFWRKRRWRIFEVLEEWGRSWQKR
jgi:glycosyltransferase involved in cell wall biosynthesis